jgi:hypothetical protein
METDRRIILRLIAMGRISPTEAERLLLAWSSGRENDWVLAGCIVAASMAQLNLRTLLPGLQHVAHSMMSWDLGSLHRALSLLTHLLGGAL